MPKYFFVHTHLSDAEKEMMQVPNFEEIPRKNHELIVAADCKDCAYQTLSISQRIRDKISCEKCPFLTERLLAGDADRLVCLDQVRQEEMPVPDSLFFCKRHKSYFESLRGMIPHDRNNQEETTVLYLIAFSETLYQRFEGGTIETALRCLETRGLDMESYIILCIAKDILMKTSYTSRNDYADKEIMSDQIIALVYCSLFVLRYGLNAKSRLRRLK